MLRRARGGNLGTPSLSSRPIALRPTDNNYPPVIINSEGTWVHISKPPGSVGREPTTVPVAIPGTATSSVDPTNLLTKFGVIRHWLVATLHWYPPIIPR